MLCQLLLTFIAIDCSNHFNYSLDLFYSRNAIKEFFFSFLEDKTNVTHTKLIQLEKILFITRPLFVRFRFSHIVVSQVDGEIKFNVMLRKLFVSSKNGHSTGCLSLSLCPLLVLLILEAE